MVLTYALGIEPLSELFFFDSKEGNYLLLDSKKKASGESPSRRERHEKLNHLLTQTSSLIFRINKSTS